MQTNIYKFLALICSVLTFFGVGYVFYSGGTIMSAFAAFIPMMGVSIFTRLSKK